MHNVYLCFVVNPLQGLTQNQLQKYQGGAFFVNLLATQSLHLCYTLFLDATLLWIMCSME